MHAMILTNHHETKKLNDLFFSKFHVNFIIMTSCQLMIILQTQSSILVFVFQFHSLTELTLELVECNFQQMHTG